MRMLSRLIEEHRLIRRLIMVWAVILITIVTHKVFWDTPNIPTGTATAYSIAVGLLATVIALYKWSRELDEQRKHTERLAGMTANRPQAGDGE